MVIYQFRLKYLPNINFRNLNYINYEKATIIGTPFGRLA